MDKSLRKQKTPARWLSILTTSIAAALISPSTHAFNGYFYGAQGIKSKGMAGATTAMTGDAFAGANNPASSLFSGDRFEIGFERVLTHQTSERYGSGGFAPPASDVLVSGSSSVNVPEFGMNRVISPDVSLGISVYRNGLVRSYYDNNQFFNILATTDQPDRLRFFLEQDVIAPVVSVRVGEESSFGFSPLLVRQTLRIDGIGAFVSNNLTRFPGDITNNGRDVSSGVGYRIGFMSRLTEKLMFGATHSPKISMGSFSRYKGLFTDNGDFDVPENSSVGIAVVVNPVTVVSIDYQRIQYSGVKLLNVSSTVFSGATSLFGDPDGPGFGWNNVRVWKFGYEWRFRSDLTFRLGFSRNNSPIKNTDVTMAVLMPNITTQERALGATYKLTSNLDLSAYYASSKGPKLTGGIDPVFQSNIPESLEVRNHSYGLQLGYQF